MKGYEKKSHRKNKEVKSLRNKIKYALQQKREIDKRICQLQARLGRKLFIE